MILQSVNSLWSIASLLGCIAVTAAKAGSYTTGHPVHVPAPTTYTYGSFVYTQESSIRYATPLPTPLAAGTAYAPHFTKASTLLPTNVIYTTFSLNRDATSTADGRYGQSAYAALWANLTYAENPPFTTTASAIALPSNELIYPPTLYNKPVDHGLKLPSDFIWGVAGSSWQIEGGLQVEGRGPSILDSLGALPNKNGANDSNVGAMNYFLYKQDIARLAAIGVPYYSFSIAWSRVVPFGVAGSPVNTEALAHYDDVINTCLEYGITPIVTLFHIDAPSTVDFEARKAVDDFLYYAKQVMTRYADRVPIWVTINEPNIALGYQFKSYNGYTNFLLMHAAVYDWYKKILGGTAKITTKFSNNLAVPLDPTNNTHVAVAHRYQNFILGIMCNPLFLGQQYPADVLATPGVDLEPLTDAQIKSLHGRIDFFAFDPYVAQYASPVPHYQQCITNSSDPAFPYCATFTNIQSNGWPMGQASQAYSYIAPQYVRQQFGYVWNTFKPAGGIMVTEFGFNPFDDRKLSGDKQRFDLLRTLYYQDFLEETLKAIHFDGIKVIGALAWSFIDNNEFGSFADQYGLQSVNMTDRLFTRQFKRSIFDYIDFFHGHIKGK